MLALCLMLSVTYYAQNYAGIIGWSLYVSLAAIGGGLVQIDSSVYGTIICKQS